jgi:hypothetical protein
MISDIAREDGSLSCVDFGQEISDEPRFRKQWQAAIDWLKRNWVSILQIAAIVIPMLLGDEGDAPIEESES